MTEASIVPFLLIIKELETKLWSILQDLQCTSRSNSKWAGGAFSQKQGDWMLVCRCVKLRFQVKNEKWKQTYWWLWKGRFIFQLWRPHHFSIYVPIMKGWVRSSFITLLWNLHIILWSYHFYLSFYSHLTEQENYSCCIVWCYECPFYNLIT